MPYRVVLMLVLLLFSPNTYQIDSLQLNFITLTFFILCAITTMCCSSKHLFKQRSLGATPKPKMRKNWRGYRIICLSLVNSFWIRKIWIEGGKKKLLPASVINVYRVIKRFTVNHMPRGIWEICQFSTPDLHLLRNSMLFRRLLCSTLHKLISKHFTSQFNK